MTFEEWWDEEKFQGCKEAWEAARQTDPVKASMAKILIKWLLASSIVAPQPDPTIGEKLIDMTVDVLIAHEKNRSLNEE